MIIPSIVKFLSYVNYLTSFMYLTQIKKKKTSVVVFVIRNFAFKK